MYIRRVTSDISVIGDIIHTILAFIFHSIFVSKQLTILPIVHLFLLIVDFFFSHPIVMSCVEGEKCWSCQSLYVREEARSSWRPLLKKSHYPMM